MASNEKNKKHENSSTSSSEDQLEKKQKFDELLGIDQQCMMYLLTTIFFISVNTAGKISCGMC